MAASSDYVAEGDGFGIYDGGLTQHSDELPRHPIIQAAENGDIAEVRRQLSLGIPLPTAIYHSCLIGLPKVLEVLIAVGGAASLNARSRAGWTALAANSAP